MKTKKYNVRGLIGHTFVDNRSQRCCIQMESDGTLYLGVDVDHENKKVFKRMKLTKDHAKYIGAMLTFFTEEENLPLVPEEALVPKESEESLIEEREFEEEIEIGFNFEPSPANLLLLELNTLFVQ
jgi:hypothetical protein